MEDYCQSSWTTWLSGLATGIGMSVIYHVSQKPETYMIWLAGQYYEIKQMVEGWQPVSSQPAPTEPYILERSSHYLIYQYKSRYYIHFGDSLPDHRTDQEIIDREIIEIDDITVNWSDEAPKECLAEWEETVCKYVRMMAGHRGNFNRQIPDLQQLAKLPKLEVVVSNIQSITVVNEELDFFEIKKSE